MPRGTKTTEFWLCLFYGCMVLVNGTEYVNVPWEQMAVAAGVFGTYIGGRSWQKLKERKVER